MNRVRKQESDSTKKTAAIVDIFERMAKRAALSQIENPVAWQKEIRKDKPLHNSSIS